MKLNKSVKKSKQSTVKTILNRIFSKKTVPAFQNSRFKHSAFRHTRHANNTNKTEPTFSAFDLAPTHEDYHVAEISFEEFKGVAAPAIERRKFPRKPGETRSAYSKKS